MQEAVEVTNTYEKRKSPAVRMTIKQILDFMQNEADARFEGDLQNNVGEIFPMLALQDQKTFFRKSLMLHWEHQIDLAKKDLQDVSVDHDVTIDRSSIVTERKSIQEINFEEQVKLKTWMQKSFFVFGVLAFFGVIGYTHYVSGGSIDVNSVMEHLENIIKLLV